MPELCETCQATLEVAPLPPPRRPARPCQRCNHTRFVRTLPREYAARGGDYAVAYALPMYAASAARVGHTLWSGSPRAEEPHTSSGVGLLEVYICLGCGLVEWYCHGAEQIPIGPEHMTEVIDVGAAGPYR
ncbi:MAG: hypothetical protein KA190_11315 [Kofleriaceae bacterium]|nr:hypothetical protein [Kofleriaceae bacterium]